MAIYAQSKLATPYMGHYGPVNLYRGGQKISGWSWAERQGAVLEFEDTYNDAVIRTITGRSEQAVTVQGKNLFDMNRLFEGDFIAANGEYVNDKTFTWLYGNKKYMQGQFLPNMRYTLTQTIKSPAGHNKRLQFAYTDGTASGSVVSNGEYDTVTFISQADKTIDYIRAVYSTQGTLVGEFYIEGVQLELGTTATPYEPFVPNSPSPEYPSPILMAGGCDLVSQNADGSKSSSIAIPELGSLPNGVKDTLTYKGGGMWEFVPRIGHIASYNGETITTPYISTTGELTAGAEVYYQLAEPVVTLLPLGELQTFPRKTLIHQDTTGVLADLQLRARVVDKEV